MDNIEDNGSNNGGIFSRFQERLKKIRISRSKKKKLQDEFVKEKVQEIKKEIRSDNTVYRTHVVGIGERRKKKINKSNVKVSKQVKSTNVENINNVDKIIADIKATKNDRNYSKKKVGISASNKLNVVNVVEPNNKLKQVKNKVKEVRENKPQLPRKKVGAIYSYNDNNINRLNTSEKEELIKTMGADIIDKIKSGFEDRLDELAVIESELFLVSQKQDETIELNKIKELKKRINELIKEINVVIDEYNLYKSNFYIENVVGLNDNVLVDDIISYRRLLDSLAGEKKFIKEYKALEEFKSLRSSLEGIKHKTELIKEENEEKIEKFDIRDKKYDNIKIEMSKVKDINNSCNEEINKQNKYFADIMSKVSKINKEEYVTKHMKGIGNLIGQSLKYMGLLMISPFAGLIPSIAIQTLATKKMIGNIYQQLNPEEVKHVRYSAINYESELNKHLTDVNYTEDLLCDTLNDVKRLKDDFLSIYNSSLPGYEDTLKNIVKIENMIVRNQNRVDMVKKNLKKSKRLNEKKLVLVKDLNS